MNLWERELAPFQSKLDELSPPQRLALAVAALERAYWTEPEPYEEPEPERWLASAIRAGRKAMTGGALNIALPPVLRAEFGTIEAEVTEPGVAQLLAAVWICVTRDVLDTDAVLEVLFSCYGFTMERQIPEPLAIEEEEENERCLEVIAFHKELITRATASAGPVPRDL